jgi:hypothetical protein
MQEETDRYTEMRMTISVPELGTDGQRTENRYCRRRTIGVPGLLLLREDDDRCTRIWDRRTDGQNDRRTEGQKIVIAGGERSVYRDSGWILSRIIL